MNDTVKRLREAKVPFYRSAVLLWLGVAISLLFTGLSLVGIDTTIINRPKEVVAPELGLGTRCGNGLGLAEGSREREAADVACQKLLDQLIDAATPEQLRRFDQAVRVGAEEVVGGGGNNPSGKPGGGPPPSGQPNQEQSDGSTGDNGGGGDGGGDGAVGMICTITDSLGVQVPVLCP